MQIINKNKHNGSSDEVEMGPNISTYPEHQEKKVK